jgi:DNA-binding beta-propeller fold protein YncE
MLLLVFPLAASAQLMIIGNDEKVTWDDAGKLVVMAPGKDTVSIVDISMRESPRIVANLPLMNSIFGPPTNLAITPDGRVAIVANSVNPVPDGAGWKFVPDNKLYVIDLTTNPPSHIGTVEVGKQPSGLDINRAGNLALVTNRADNSISVLSIQGKDVKLVDTVPMGDQVAAVAFTPDGKRALAAKFPGHKVALLEVDGQKVTYKKYDMNVGLWPYNVAVTPNGKLAISANNGNSGAADGQVDTVSIIDLKATPPARHRPCRGRGWAGGLRHQPHGQDRRGTPGGGRQLGQDRVVLQTQRQRGGAEDRRQESDEGRRGRVGRASRRGCL